MSHGDDTEKLQNALDHGGVVKLEPIRYRHHGLHIRQDVRLSGAGIGQTLLLHTGTRHAITVGDTKHRPVVEIDGVTLDGLSGLIGPNDPDDGFGIFVIDGEELTFRDLEVRNTPFHALHVGYTGYDFLKTDVRIERVRVRDAGGYGIGVSGTSGFRIQDCDVERTGSHGIATLSGDEPAPTTPTTDGIISGNRVSKAEPPSHVNRGIGRETGHLIHIGSGTRRVVVSNNVLSDTRNAATDGIGMVAQPDIEEIVVAGNIVSLAGAYGIDASAASVVQGNVVDRPGTYGIVVSHDTRQATAGTVIANNVVRDAGEADDALGYRAGIYVLGEAETRDLVIAGNVVLDTRPDKRTAYGVLLNAQGAGMIVGVTLTGNRAVAVARKGFVSIGNVIGIVESGNRWREVA